MARRGLYGTFACLIVMMWGVAAAGAVPAPCGEAQISDASTDGHHANTNVLAAWLSERSGRLQAVIKVNHAVWEPAHEDSQYASLAFLFQVGARRGTSELRLRGRRKRSSSITARGPGAAHSSAPGRRAARPLPAREARSRSTSPPRPARCQEPS